MIFGRDEDWAVGATSKFAIFTLSVCPFIRTGILSCVDAVVQVFKNLARLTFELGALYKAVCLCALRRDLLANDLKCLVSVSCGKQLVERWVLQPLDFPAFGWQASCCRLPPETGSNFRGPHLHPLWHPQA